MGSLIEKLTSPDVNLSPDPVVDSDGTLRHPGLDNHGMGTIFEDLIRRFNEENNEEERSAVVHARVKGKAGMGNADVKMTSRVVALGPEETEVTVVADLTVLGILAQLGRGMMQHVSKKVFKGFTEVLGKELT